MDIYIATVYKLLKNIHLEEELRRDKLFKSTNTLSYRYYRYRKKNAVDGGREDLSKAFRLNVLKSISITLWIAMVSLFMVSPWAFYRGKIVVIESVVGSYGIVGVSVNTKDFFLTVKGINIVKILTNLDVLKNFPLLTTFIPILFIITLVTILLNQGWATLISSFATLLMTINFLREIEQFLYLLISRITPILVEVQSIEIGYGYLSTLITSTAICIVSALSIYREGGKTV